jgi:Holliday junction resolvasome RuvABC endonuclease subunit
MKEYIWAFDISMSQTGISIFNDDGRIEFITSIDTSKGKTHAGKLKIIADGIYELRKKYGVKEIVMEQGFTRFNASTQAIFKCVGIVNLLFYDKPQTYYPATTVKKCVGGIGNIKKDELRDIIIEKYPEIKFDNLDQSDSFAVGLCYFIKNGIMKGII